MASTVETAIAMIRSVGDELCENQVYYFDDYDFDPETGLGDATALCTRLGIPVTGDILIEYPASRTYLPLTESQIASFEKSLCASLPDDYKPLLATFGAFHLPGNADIFLSSPSAAISTTGGSWWFDDPTTMPVLAIAPYRLCCDGDSIGFIRKNDEFGPALFVLKHELRHEGDDPALWTERIAESVSAFAIKYLEKLA
jgi:hypothetical protein